MSSDDELKKFLQNYLLYGIAFVDDVPATVEATEEVTKRVSLIRYLVFLGFSGLCYSATLCPTKDILIKLFHISKFFSMATFKAVQRRSAPIS